jgi:hypothetical protein
VRGSIRLAAQCRCVADDSDVRRHGLALLTTGCSTLAMQLATGTIIDGNVAAESASLPEGTVVTVLARDTDETFELPPELESELAASIAEADRGETVTAVELFERLRRIA